MTTRFAVAALLAFAVLSWRAGGVDAHITVKSQYTFNRDVRPILQRRCTQCHTAGGVAPTSLRTYDEVRAKSLSFRRSLMSGRMPPWSGESNLVALKEQQSLTARELDILMTWSAGGTPEGPATDDGPMPSVTAATPDAILAMPAPFVLAAGRQDAEHEVVLPSADLAGKWIRAVTVLPGAPAIARRAEISLRSRAGEQVVGLWLPGDVPQEFAGNGAFLVPAGGVLRLRMSYRQPDPSVAMDVIDRSRVGIYFASAPAAPVHSVAITSGRQRLTRARRLVGIRPVAAPPDAVVTITVAARDGDQPITLLRFTSRPEWRRRYLFAAPVDLPRGSRIEVTVAPARSGLWQTLIAPVEGTASTRNIFRGVLEFIE